MKTANSLILKKIESPIIVKKTKNPLSKKIRIIRANICRRIGHKIFDISKVRLGDVLFENGKYGKRFGFYYNFYNDGPRQFSITFSKFITFVTNDQKQYGIIKPKYIKLLRDIIAKIVGRFTVNNYSISPNFNLSYNAGEKIRGIAMKVCDFGDMGEGYRITGTQRAEVVLTMYIQYSGRHSQNVVPTAFINFIDDPDEPTPSTFNQTRKQTITK